MNLDALRITLLLALGACTPTAKPVDTASTDTSLPVTEPCRGGVSTPVILADGTPSGYERCEDGTFHRVSAAPVDPTIPDASCAGTESNLGCTTDADCSEGLHGKCITGVSVGGRGVAESYCGCVYSCAGDADCGAEQVCVPPGIVSTGADYPYCAPAACRSDDACASGECGLSSWNTGCATHVQIACRDSDLDACRVTEDCEEGTCSIETDHWTCNTEDCAIGRLLLVDERARLAPEVARNDWTAGQEPLPVNAAIRALLAQHWRGAAAAEHASVGSFARFTLQLLAMGAPPDLLADTQRAAADEVRHAQLCYGFVSAYGGVAVGPGALALEGSAPGLDARSVIRGLVEEACVGETVGAAEAETAARGCADPAVRAALLEIAADETRHAALAWRALKWMLTDVAPDLRGYAAKRLTATMAGMARPRAEGPSGLASHGILSPAERSRIRLEAIEAVVRPCAAAVLGEVEGGHRTDGGSLEWMAT